MNALWLRRMTEGPGVPTYGRIEDEHNVQICVTLEEPWVDENGDYIGDTGVSRIPDGSWVFKRRLSPKRGYEVFECNEVPGRSNIQIHKGATLEHTEGCILVGESITKHGIAGAKTAFPRFMKKLEGQDEFILHIEPPI